MRFRINKYIFPLVFFGLFYAGCAALPTRFTPLPVLKDPAFYLEASIKKARTINNVSGYAKLKISAGGKTSTSRNVFFVSRPDLIRIEILGFLSRPALFFTADSMSFSIYVIANNVFCRGEPTAENVQRIIGMRLALREVVLSFMGEPPLVDCTHKKISYRQDKNQYLFTIASKAGNQLVWIDPLTGTITGYTLYEHASPLYRYVFSNFQNFDGRLFPLKIDIHHYTNTTDATLEFDSISFEPISPELFIMDVPTGATIIGIEELGLRQ